MATTSDHCNHHLSRIYSWMVGDIEAALVRSAAELDAIGLPAVRAGTTSRRHGVRRSEQDHSNAYALNCSGRCGAQAPRYADGARPSFQVL
jgi:hypothetical protein